MMQLRFAIGDLWRRKWLSLLLFAQLTLVLFIANFAVASLKDLEQTKQEVQRLTTDTPIYFLKDFTTDAHAMELTDDNPDALEKFKRLYDDLYKPQHNAKVFSLDANSLPFDKTVFSSSLETLAVEGNIVDVPTLNATDALQHYFQLDVAQGRYFNDRDYTQKTSARPIVIGAELGKSLHLHDTIQDSGQDTYEVVGILKPQLSYINIASDRNFISLDNAILLPQNKQYLTDGLDYYTLLSATYIATDDENVVKNIVQRGNADNMFTWAYSDLQQQVQYVIADKTEWIQMQLMLTILMLIFTFVSVTVAYLQFIEQYTYEFGVHILSGATRFSIMIRICSQLLILFLLANVVVMCFLHTPTQLFISFIVTFVSCLCLWVIPIIKLMRTTIDQMLRWR